MYAPAKLGQEAHSRVKFSRGKVVSGSVNRSSRRLAVLIRASGADDSRQQQRRVVVTGLGVVSCLGHDPDTFYERLLSGESGVSQITRFNASDYSTRIAGEIKDFDTGPYINKKTARRVDDVIKYTMVSGKRALEHAGIGLESRELEALNRVRCGILMGSAFGGMLTFTEAIETYFASGHRKMNPFCIPFSITNMPGAMLAMDLGFMGPNYPINTACATGNYCISTAADHIRRGDADLMVAGGAEAAIMPSGIGGFIACKALSKRNDDPARASRPWDKSRDGFVMGEGAGALVLEEYEHAKARGATILCEYVGGAFTSDAYAMTDPHPEGKGVQLCIEKALKATGIRPEQVNYINAHATSTLAGDMAEYKAITNALPGPKKVNSTKSMIGHLLGAAGAVEAVATIQALRTGWVHPNLNIDDPEPTLDMNVIVGAKKEKLDIDVALSNSFGFGGHNSCIMFAKFKE